MPIGVVIDTNVLVSGLINLHAPPGRVVDWLRGDIIQAVVDDRILAEYRDVLFRERLRRWIAEQDAWDILTFLEYESRRVVAGLMIAGLPDPGDAAFLEVAASSGVSLITGNIKHFPEDQRQGARVVTPAEFVAELSR